MKMSNLALSTNKHRLSSDECLSFRILLQAGLLCRYGTGIYAQHNLLVRSQEKIRQIIRSTLEFYDCVEVSLPILQPKYIWEESGRWDHYANSGQMFISNMSNGTYCFAPTAEEAMFSLVKDTLKSYKDLPVNLYQIGPKFRNELRARGGLLRTKEFLMMDAYSFHSSEKSLKEEYCRMKEAYFKIFEQIGLNVIPVAAVNGDMGGNMSEEFMFLSDSGEDTILVDETGKIGLNTELLEVEDSNNFLESNYGITDVNSLTQQHCIELGHIFELGQRYSSSMNGTFKDENNNSIPYYMGCYGIGISRTLAAICEQNCDEQGLIWPQNIAPYTVSIVYTHDKKDEAFNLYSSIVNSNIEALIDDRNLSLGAKIKDSKLLGIPYMIIIGNNTQDGIYEIEIRKNGQKLYVPFKQLLNLIK